MAILRRSSRSFPRAWNKAQVPTFAAEVDPSHPLYSGMASAYLFRDGSPRNILTGSAPFAEVRPQGIATPYGPGAFYGGAQSSQFGDGVVTTGSAWTIAFLAQGNLGAGNTVYAEQKASTWPGNLLTIYYGSGFVYYMQDNAGANSNPSASISNAWHLAVMVQTATNSRISYIDGASVITDTNTVQPLLSTTTSFGASINGTTPGQIGTFSIAGGWAWNRALSAPEMALLQQQPFGMFRPAVRRAYFIPAAGGAFTASLSDTSVTSDAFTAALAALTTLSDTSASSDTLTGSMAATGALSDTSATSDAQSSAMAALASLSDTSATSESWSGAMAGTGSLADSSTASDSLTPTMAAAATLADTAASSDSFTGSMSATATLTDTSSTSDLWTIPGSGVYTGSWADTATTSDSFTAILNASATLADSATASDFVSAIAGLTATLTDTAVTSDHLTGSAAFLASVADSVSTSDAWIIGNTFVPSPRRTIAPPAASARTIAAIRNGRTIILP